MGIFIIITTINPKSEGIARFERMDGWNIVVVGDKKSEPIASSSSLTFLSVNDQMKLGYDLVEICPYNHYTRKNIGYLYAMQHGAEVIYDTDDDNLPYDSWRLLDFVCSRKIVSALKFVNMYKYYTEELIWPRGYPLDDIYKGTTLDSEEIQPVEVGIWQGLADNDPDVDAVYRLAVNKKVRFADKLPVVLERGNYCPINSQNTFWSKKTFPYLYLPAATSFRFTDILRGYIAQRLLWEQNLRLGFTGATVYQERNEHELMRDFEDEVECYLHTKPIVSLLGSLNLTSEPVTNLMTVYDSLVDNGLVSARELITLQAWIADLRKFHQ
jgi:hypothetical protein